MSAQARARYGKEGLQQLNDMVYPLPLLGGSDEFAGFIECFNRKRLAPIPRAKRPLVDLETWDVVNCYPSTDSTDAIIRRKEFTAELRRRILKRHGNGAAAPPVNVGVNLDAQGEYQARFTNEPTGDPSGKKSVFSLAKLLSLFKFLLESAPFEFMARSTCRCSDTPKVRHKAPWRSATSFWVGTNMST